MPVEIAVIANVRSGVNYQIMDGPQRQMILIGMWQKCVRLALNGKRTYKVTWNEQWAKLLYQKGGPGAGEYIYMITYNYS